MIEIEVPGGQVLEFPDEMSQDQIKDIISKKFPKEEDVTKTPETASELRAASPMEQLRMTDVGRAIERGARGFGEAVDTAFKFASVPPQLRPIAKGALEQIPGVSLTRAAEPFLGKTGQVAEGLIQGGEEMAVNFPIAMPGVSAAAIPSGILRAQQMRKGIGAADALNTALMGLFAGQYAISVPEQYEAFKQARAAGDIKTATQIATQALANGLLIGIGSVHQGKSIAGKLLDRRMPDASSVEEAAAVHGDVLAQPEQSARQVPTQEGGQGVQPQAQTVAKTPQVSLTLPDIKGSERQVPWASNIRQKTLAGKWSDEQKQQMAQITDAGWWIDNKDKLAAGEFTPPAPKPPEVVTPEEGSYQLAEFTAGSEKQRAWAEKVRAKVLRQAWTPEERQQIASKTDPLFFIVNRDELAKGTIPQEVSKAKSAELVDHLKKAGWTTEEINRLTTQQAEGIAKQGGFQAVQQELPPQPQQASIPTSVSGAAPQVNVVKSMDGTYSVSVSGGQRVVGIATAQEAGEVAARLEDELRKPQAQPKATIPTTETGTQAAPPPVPKAGQTELPGMPAAVAARKANRTKAEGIANEAGVQFLDGRELGGEQPFAKGSGIISRAMGGGKVAINWPEFHKWLEQEVPKGQEEQAIRSMIDEERVHNTVIDALGGLEKAKPLMEQYWKDMSWLERKINNKRYSGSFGQAESDANMGHEALRFRMQRAARMTPTEFATTAGAERWTLKSLTAMEDFIRGARELMGTKASERQNQLFNRMSMNIGAAKVAVAAQEHGPAARRRKEGEPEESGMDFARRVVKMSPQQFVDEAKGFNSVNLKLGQTASLEEVAELVQLRGQAVTRYQDAMREAKANPSPETYENFGILSSMPQFYEEAIAEARRSAQRPQPGTVRVYHGEGGPEGGGMGSLWFSTNPKRAASYGGNVSFVDVPREVFERGADAVRKTGKYTEGDTILPDEFISQAKPVDVAPEVFEVEAPAARRRKQDTSEQRFMEFDMPMGTVQYKDPNYKPPPVEHPTGEELGVAQRPQVERSLQQYLEKPIFFTKEDAPELQDIPVTGPQFHKGPPSFRQFQSWVERNIGAVDPESMRTLWEGNVWDYLSQVGGARLLEMVKAYKLERRPGVGGADIADPTAETNLRQGDLFSKGKEGATEEGKALMAEQARKRAEKVAELRKKADEAERLIAQAQSEAAGYKPPRNVKGIEQTPFASKEQLQDYVRRMRSRATLTEAAVNVEPYKRIKERTPEENRALQAQRRRLTVISALADRMMRDVAPNEAQLKREDFSIDDVAFDSPNAADVAWFPITMEMSDNPEKLAQALRKEARRSSADPVSNTKRLVALKNKRTREMLVVSAFYDGKTKSIKVTNPSAFAGAGEENFVPLNDITTNYRPVYGILLNDPVRGFIKRFKTTGSFDDYIGTEANRIHRSMQYDFPEPAPMLADLNWRDTPEGVLADYEIEGTPELEGEGGIFTGNAARVARAQMGMSRGTLEQTAKRPLNAVEVRSLFDFATDFGEQMMKSPLEMEKAVALLRSIARKNAERRAQTGPMYTKPEGPPEQAMVATGLSPRDRTALSGIYKIAKSIWREAGGDPETGRNGDITAVEAYHLALRDFYDLMRKSDSMADLTARALYNWGPIPDRPPEFFIGKTPEALRLAELRAEARGKYFGSRIPLERWMENRAKLSPSFYAEEFAKAPEVEVPRPEIALPKAGQPLATEVEIPERATERFKEPQRFPLPRSEPQVVNAGPQLLDPAAARHVEEMAAKDYPYDPTKPSEVSESASELGHGTLIERKVQTALAQKKGLSPSEYKPGFEDLPDAPAARRRNAVNRAYNASIDEFLDIVGQVYSNFTRQGVSRKIVARRDAASNIPVTLSQMAKNSIAVESASKKNPNGDPEVLSAARARNTVERLNPRTGRNWTYAELNSLLQSADTKAELWIRHGNAFEKQMGKKWKDKIHDMRQEVAYSEAHHNDPVLVRTVEALRRELDTQYALERTFGGRLGYDQNYLPGMYDGEFFDDNAITWGEKTILGRQYRKPAMFDNYYEAIEAGPYIPASDNVADIAASRIRPGMTRIMEKSWFNDLKTYRDPKTRTPIAIDTIKVGDQWVVPPGNADRVAMSLVPGQKPLAVLRGYKRLVNQMTLRSQVDESQLGRAALRVTSLTKHGIILFADTFHLGRLFDYGASIIGTDMFKTGFKHPSFNAGYSALEYRPQDLAKAVARGAIPRDVADYALKPEVIQGPTGPVSMTRQEIGQTLQREGLNVGRVQDALYKHFVDSWPFIGKFNRWLFDKVTRGVMHEVAVNEFIRQNKLDPTMPVDNLAGKIARDTNIFFGSLGRQGLIRGATYRDIAQMIFLAPQWVEGLVRKEASFYSRLPVAAVQLAMGRPKQASLHLGTIGRGMGRGLAVCFAIAQAANLISRGQMTWQNEDGHEMDAWLPDPSGKTKGFWFNFASVFSEVLHDMVRLHETKDNFWSEIRQIGENKLGIPGKVAVVLKEQRTPQGYDITSTAGVLKEAAKAAVPVPISLAKPAREVGHAIAPDLIGPNRPGEAIRQGIASMGVKVDPVRESGQRVMKMAQQWMADNGLAKTTGWKQVMTDEASYSKLRMAIRNGDNVAAKNFFEELKKGRTDVEVIKAMKVNALRPFTGNKRAERMFLYSLKPSERALYDEAINQRHQEFMRFLDWYTKN